MSTVIESKTKYGKYIVLKEESGFLGGISYVLYVDGSVHSQSKDKDFMLKQFYNY
ncbi:TPA: hypothetical protein ACGO2A_000907 [Streptococcus suis]|uniref:hypothetical protein n=1 Tax=Streptococcus suis TaxID=1307 RepID=UPI00137A7E13|nr:hypothetical protein [Streptococcus suis]MBY4955556.1 hypothetical protein [Streptococcus suis]MBY4970286.1 hypothetical protein [Streptococcus suis]MBY5016763.1 hypothetical protein [Streptococcus suis]NQJ69936.1 hypothetical protein [Streptococcus suis]NQJ73313.1 hypothetical protein [Streptococcus suis]